VGVCVILSVVLVNTKESSYDVPFMVTGSGQSDGE
jgi:hypothetical protein